VDSIGGGCGGAKISREGNTGRIRGLKKERGAVERHKGKCAEGTFFTRHASRSATHIHVLGRLQWEMEPNKGDG